VALTLLVVTGVLCWTVVVPVWQVKRELAEAEKEATVGYVINNSKSASPDIYFGVSEPAITIDRLGGSREAARKISLYLRMPKWVATDRKAALEMLYSCKGQAVPTLVVLSGDEDKAIRQKAVRYLGLLRAPQGFRPVLAALGDEDEEVRHRAAWALGEIGDRRGVDPLIGSLRDESKEVRRWSAAALGAIGDRRATLALAAASGDRDADVRYRVVVALGRLGDDRALAALMFALKDPDAHVSRAAHEAFAKIGTADETAGAKAKR